MLVHGAREVLGVALLGQPERAKGRPRDPETERQGEVGGHPPAQRVVHAEAEELRLWTGVVAEVDGHPKQTQQRVARGHPRLEAHRPLPFERGLVARRHPDRQARADRQPEEGLEAEQEPQRRDVEMQPDIARHPRFEVR